MSQARCASFSPLLKGPSIFEQLQKSHFRNFYSAFKKVRTYLTDEDFLTLPKLVVVGTSSAGKSSLLENITKCAIFPRDKKLCTKFPLRLRIQQVSDIKECGVTISHDGIDVPLASPDEALEVVTKIMNQAERLDDLTGQELLVIIKQADVPTFEFIDLPGIQTASPQAHAQSLDLINPYLRDDNTLVLCVVDATESLDDCAALEAVRRQGKLKQAILVLTKADKVFAEGMQDVNEYLFDRILNKAADCKILSELRGVVAIANRKHTDMVTLLQAVDEENQQFEAMLQAATGSYAAETAQQHLRDGMTTQKLLEKMDSMYHVHMVEVWGPTALARIHVARCNASTDLAALGNAPDNLSANNILQDLHRAVDFEDICVRVDQMAAQLMQPMPSYTAPDPASRVLSEWAEAIIDLEPKVHKAVSAALDSKAYMDIILAAYDQAFSKGKQLGRFSTLRERLAARELPDLVGRVMHDSRTPINAVRDATLRELHNSAATGDILEPLRSCVRNYLVKHMVLKLKVKPLEFQSGFDFVEDPETREKRRDLEHKIDRLKHAHKIIGDFTNPQADGNTPAPAVPHASEFPVAGPSSSVSFKAPLDPVLMMPGLRGESASPTYAAPHTYAHSDLFEQESVGDSDDGLVINSAGVPPHSQLNPL